MSKPESRTRFPNAWTWLMDDTLPGWVKRHYSPRESWKDKPFDRPDAQFFFRGIEELSELFTEERPRAMPAYFQHGKFRSAYLLYFLPLQAAKFTTVFQLHPQALEAAVAHGRRTGAMRVLDLGAGPGTASLALLLQLLDLTLKPGEQLPPIEMDWYDLNRGVLEDGKALAELLATSFPKLRGKLTVRVHARTWWEAVAPAETSLVLLGNVLNEASNFLPKRRHEGPEGSPLDSEEAETSGPNAASFARGVPKAASFDRGGPGEDEILPGEARAARLAPPLRALVELSRRARGGGVLIVEPAFRKPSQTVSQLRDYLLMTEAIPSDVTSIWGPCPHAQACPLATGRDWCHFSIPAEIPGQWFKAFSRGLGSERHWVKFSYLWLSSPDARAPRPEPGLRLVVSDPIATSAGDRVVLLCEPSSPARLSIPRNLELLRGDWIDPTRIRAVRPGPGPKPAIGRAGGRSGQKPSAGPVSRRKRPRR